MNHIILLFAVHMFLSFFLKYQICHLRLQSLFSGITMMPVQDEVLANSPMKK